MKARFAINIPFAMAVLIGSVSAVHAQGLTRDQVRAELREAIRTGDILVGGEHGMTAYEMAPHRYPARPPVVGKTREQVRAELVEAVRTGDILVSGSMGLGWATSWLGLTWFCLIRWSRAIATGRHPPWRERRELKFAKNLNLRFGSAMRPSTARGVRPLSVFPNDLPPFVRSIGWR